MRRETAIPLTGLFLFMILWGCGYGLEGRATPLTREIQTIAVPTVGNETMEAGIEDVFTRALIREFNLDGRILVVPEKRADGILRGSIQDFSIASLSYDATGLVLEYRATVILGLTLQRVDTGQVIWSEPSMQEVEEYRVVSDALTNEARKREAVEEIARELAETVHDLILGGF